MKKNPAAELSTLNDSLIKRKLVSSTRFAGVGKEQSAEIQQEIRLQIQCNGRKSVGQN